MSLQIKQLGSGKTLAGLTDDVVYDCIAGKSAIVKNIRLVNTGTGTATINVLLRKTTSSADDVQISPKDISLPPGEMYIDNDEITLSRPTTSDPAMKLRVTASGTGATVAYLVSGVERDLA
jgi:hypothetical protein